jgi:hypothetical protein
MLPSDGKPRYWAVDQWWLTEEYAQVYREKISLDEMDRAIRRVADVFTKKWQDVTPQHPVYYWLLSKGLVPLDFLYVLGKNLIALEECLRLPSVVRDLRHPGDYESAMLEVGIAAHLRRAGHQIEFRPKLPNGKSSDFVADSKGQQAYFEVKRLRESDRQLAIGDLGNLIASELMDLTSSPIRPRIQGKHYEVVIDAAVFYSLGKGCETDHQIIQTVRECIAQEVVRRLDTNLPLQFVIPSVATVKISDSPMEGSSVMCPMASSEAELDRLLKGHFGNAIEQLHPGHAGIIIVQTPAELESEMSETVINDLLLQLGRQVSHISAVLILPVYNWMPQTWSLFRPFLVANCAASIPPANLAVFPELREFLEISVKTPMDWRDH